MGILAVGSPQALKEPNLENPGLEGVPFQRDLNQGIFYCLQKLPSKVTLSFPSTHSYQDVKRRRKKNKKPHHFSDKVKVKSYLVICTWHALKWNFAPGEGGAKEETRLVFKRRQSRKYKKNPNPTTIQTRPYALPSLPCFST